MTPDAFGRAIVAYPALLRGYAGEPVTLTAGDAIALLELFDAASELATAEHQVEQLEDRVSGQSPALDRWRTLVLQSPAQQPPLAVAAAWEAHALDLERHDNVSLAHRARLAAAQIVEHASQHTSSLDSTSRRTDTAA